MADHTTGPDCGPAEEPISRAHVVDYDAQTGAPECVDDCPGCGLIDPNGVHDGTCEVFVEEQAPTVPVLSDSVRKFLTFGLNLAADRMADRGDEFDADDEAALATLRRLAEQSTPAPAGLTVYRASHDSIVMGLYTTAAAARAHCEAEERRAWAKFEDPTFDWIEDEEDVVAELVISGDDADTETGYVVTALTVASAYDEEADE